MDSEKVVIYVDGLHPATAKPKLKRNRLKHYPYYVAFKTHEEIHKKLLDIGNKSRFINKLLADYFGLKIFGLNAEIFLPKFKEGRKEK